MNWLLDLARSFPGKRILVAGDVMLDEYIMGHVGRISPEAPVPVVEIRQRTFVPGGAANTAVNVAGLGSQALLLGVVGCDFAGIQLREALQQRKVDTSGVIEDDERPTTTKTRIVAHSQQVARVDQEERRPLSERMLGRLLELASAWLPTVDACVISDYAKGVVGSRFAAGVIEAARKAGRPVVVDPKGIDYTKYRGATVVKPNVLETEQVLNCRLDSMPSLLRAGQQLLELLPGSAVLITRGAQGMSLFGAAAEPSHFPAEARDVFDVTGAGDTVAGTLAVGLAAGGTLEQAARLATKAAAVVVGKVGTTPIQITDLLGSSSEPSI